MLAAACPRPNISEAGNIFLWVTARKVLIQVKEQKHFQCLGQQELFCIDPYPLHGVVSNCFPL
jgi:hypothetical protein